MAEAEVYGFDEGSTKRIADAVHRVEKMPRNPPTPPRQLRTPIDHIDRYARVTSPTPPEANSHWYLGRLQAYDPSTDSWTDDTTGPLVYLSESATGTVVNSGAQDAGVHYSARFNGTYGGGTATSTSSPSVGGTLLNVPSTTLFEVGDSVLVLDPVTGTTETASVVSKVNATSLTVTALANGYTHPTVTVSARGVWLLIRSDIDCVVRIVSTTPNADGMQDGYIQIWDEVNNAWSDGERIWITDASSGGGSYCGVTSVNVSVPAALLSVSGGPVTSTGTIALDLVNQAANTFFAGPSSGSATTPGFRVLVAADIPYTDVSLILAGQIFGG